MTIMFWIAVILTSPFWFVLVAFAMVLAFSIIGFILDTIVKIGEGIGGIIRDIFRRN